MRKAEEYFKEAITEDMVKDWGWDSMEEFMNDPDNKVQIETTYKMIEKAQTEGYVAGIENIKHSLLGNGPDSLDEFLMNSENISQEERELIMETLYEYLHRE